jgi:hypothetical protein
MCVRAFVLGWGMKLRRPFEIDLMSVIILVLIAVFVLAYFSSRNFRPAGD